MYWSVQLSKLSPRERKAKEILLIDAYLDQGGGAAWLGEPRVAELVERAMLHFDGVRYDLHAWVVMPNHVHALFTPKSEHGLSQIMSAWKSYTAKEANKILGRNGHFWQKEYFDRVIRNPHHFDFVKEYIENNPVKAGLCQQAADWKFTSAGRDRPLWKPPSCWYEDVPIAAAESSVLESNCWEI